MPQRASPPRTCGATKATAGTLAAERAVAVLMQVTADDQAHVRPAQPVEQPRPRRRHHARGTEGILGWRFEEERFVQEQRGGPPGGAQLFVEPLVLGVFPHEAGRPGSGKRAAGGRRPATNDWACPASLLIPIRGGRRAPTSRSKQRRELWSGNRGSGQARRHDTSTGPPLLRAPSA